MFQPPGSVSQPDCQRAGMPAARHIVMNSSDCTPQSPLSVASALAEMFGIVLYSISAQYFMFCATQRKMRRARKSGFCSPATTSFTFACSSGVKTMCGGRSAVFSRYAALSLSYGLTAAGSRSGTDAEQMYSNSAANRGGLAGSSSTCSK